MKRVMRSAIMPGLILVYLLAGSVSAQDVKRVNYSDPETWLLGFFEADDLLSEPHATWYNSGFDSYIFNDSSFIELSGIPVKDITITVVLGTWCPDSRREVPRFLKLMQSWGLSMENITFIGVDSYKMAPVASYESLDIKRVPTFIIYKNKIEIGRIIEYPVTSLERDMVNILKD